VMKLQWSKTFDRMTWDDAMKFCEELKFDGHSDWRLPTRVELLALYDNGEILSDTKSDDYWSNTTYADSTDGAWYVNFTDGYAYRDDKATTYYVHAVRERKEGE
jgi:hypothetical protein